MKIETAKQLPKFASVTLTVTFETQEELDAWGRFFNCTPIVNAADAAGFNGICVRDALSSEGADIHGDLYLISNAARRPW